MRIQHIQGGTANYPPGAGLAERTMVDFEFVWIIRGNAVWRAQGIDHSAPEGTVILSQPGFVESYRWDPFSPTRHAYFHFQLTGPFAKDLPPRAKWPLVRQMPDNDIVRPLFHYVVANMREERAEGPAATRATEAMLTAFVAGPVGTGAPEDPDVPEPVHRAIQFAAETLGKTPGAAIGLADLAAAANVTTKHLCRLFREHVELSPMEAVLALRLRHAVQLMARTDFKLERIARECGFATSFHFSRRFRDMYGKPPSAIRADLAAGRYQPPARFRWGKKLTVEYPV